MTQVQPRETNLPPDSQSLPQQGRVAEREDELITASAKRLAGRIDGTETEQRPTEDPASIAKAAIRQDISTFETMMGASEAERQKIFAPTAAGRERLFRVSLHKEAPCAQAPMQSRPLLPDVEIHGACAKRQPLRRIGQPLIPPQEAKTKFAPGAIEPPRKPRPGPKLMEENQAIPGAKFKRAAGEDGRRQMRMGVKKGFPSLAQPVGTQLRCIVAGELAGARGDFGGIGPKLTNLATVALVALASYREAAAKLRYAQNMEWRQPETGRRDLSKVTQQLIELYQQRTARPSVDKKQAYGDRAQELYAGTKKCKSKGFQEKRGAGDYSYKKNKEGFPLREGAERRRWRRH